MLLVLRINSSFMSFWSQRLQCSHDLICRRHQKGVIQHFKRKINDKKVTRRFDDSIRATVTAKTKEKERSQDIWIHDF